MTAAEIAAALGGARREGKGWRCCCPVFLAFRDVDRRMLADQQIGSAPDVEFRDHR